MEVGTLAGLREFLLANELAPVKLKDGTGILVNLSGMEVLSLNETGMFILDEILGGSDSLETVVGTLSREFSVERATAEAEARQFIDELSVHLKVA